MGREDITEKLKLIKFMEKRKLTAGVIIATVAFVVNVFSQLPSAYGGLCTTCGEERPAYMEYSTRPCNNGSGNIVTIIKCKAGGNAVICSPPGTTIYDYTDCTTGGSTGG